MREPVEFIPTKFRHALVFHTVEFRQFCVSFILMVNNAQCRTHVKAFEVSSLWPEERELVSAYILCSLECPNLIYVTWYQNKNIKWPDAASYSSVLHSNLCQSNWFIMVIEKKSQSAALSKWHFVEFSVSQVRVHILFFSGPQIMMFMFNLL